MARECHNHTPQTIQRHREEEENNNNGDTSIVLASQKAGGRLALSLYVFLHTACFHFELLELVDLF